MNKGYIYLGISIVLFILGCYSYFNIFWVGQTCFFTSCVFFFLYAVNFNIEGGKLIRYQCVKCKEYSIGGAEDKQCPICGGTLTFKEIVDHD